MADSNVYDPAALAEAMARLSMAPEQQGLMKQRMQYGREDSQSQMPQGMRVGGTYVASSPLEHIAAALQRGIGLGQQRGAMGDMQGLTAQSGGDRLAYIRQMLQQMQAQQQPQAAGPYQGEVPQMIE